MIPFPFVGQYPVGQAAPQVYTQYPSYNRDGTMTMYYAAAAPGQQPFPVAQGAPPNYIVYDGNNLAGSTSNALFRGVPAQPGQPQPQPPQGAVPSQPAFYVVPQQPQMMPSTMILDPFGQMMASATPHYQSATAVPQQGRDPSGATWDNNSQSICRHYLHGRCNRRKCRFRHAGPQLFAASSAAPFIPTASMSGILTAQQSMATQSLSSPLNIPEETKPADDMQPAAAPPSVPDTRGSTAGSEAGATTQAESAASVAAAAPMNDKGLFFSPW